ncbi:MAG: hypothetical protein AAGJ85_06005, partial [Pseudomonadota bacterium]
TASEQADTPKGDSIADVNSENSEPVSEPDPLTLADDTPEIEAPEDAAPPIRHSTYDDLWRISEYWPGEWPSGFSVVGENVVVKGRNAMTPYEPLLYTCALPQGASYQPWNYQRIEADSLTFRSAFYRSAITANKAASITNESGKTLTVSPGDVMRYEEYYSDGIFLLSFNGEEYDFYTEEIEAIADFEEGEDTHLWVNVKCAEGSELDRAWLKFDEVIELDGISYTPLSRMGGGYDVIPGAAYPVTWNRADSWSGEYPSSIAVTTDDIVVWGHTYPKEQYESGDVQCPLEKNAVYTPWNQEREASYATFVFSRPITLNEDVTIQTVEANNPRNEDGSIRNVTLNLKAGERLSYESYIGEGYFLVEYEGVEYELGQGDLPDSTEFPESSEEDEWFQTTCADGTGPVWINREQALRADGITSYYYQGYGEASDLVEGEHFGGPSD